MFNISIFTSCKDVGILSPDLVDSLTDLGKLTLQEDLKPKHNFIYG